MQELFEKIIDKLEQYEYENLVEHDSEQSQHCKDAGDCKGMDCSLCVFNKAIEIVKQEAEKYNESLMAELLEAKKNCGEDSDCSDCIFGHTEDRCYLQELQIGKYNNGWIPCSEQLPEEYGDYLVAWRPLSMSGEDIMKKVGREVPHFYEIVEYDPDDEALWIGSIEQAQGEYEIIAWQPLPQPYQPKGE